MDYLIRESFDQCIRDKDDIKVEGGSRPVPMLPPYDPNVIPFGKEVYVKG